MAQTGFTPLLIYSSSTGGNAPTAGNLLNNATGSELAINIADGKLFYKDSGNAVQVIAWKTTPTTAGGTGLTSYTAGDTLYYASGTTLSKLAIGSANTVMTSSGSAPQWSSSLSISSITDSGNLTFTGAGSRILADFSNATVTNRLALQTSTVNGSTGIYALPNGTNTAASWQVSNAADPTNASKILIATNGSTDVQLVSGINGTGTYLPLTFWNNGAEKMRLFVSGGFSVGSTTDPGAANLRVNGKIGVGTAPGTNGSIIAAADAGSGTGYPLDLFNASAGSQHVQLRLYTNDNTSYGCFIDGQTSSSTTSQMRIGTSGVTQIFIGTTGSVGIGVTAPQSKLDIGGSTSGQTLTFSNTAQNTGARTAAVCQFAAATYAGTIWQSNITGAYDNFYDFTVYTSNGGSPTARLYVNSAGSVTVYGALSKGSGSFRIDHPLPEFEETHQLVHSFIEGPQADLIYRGRVTLVNGKASVNIDEASTMTEGTFEALCRDIQCFTTNESDWTAVRGSVKGNILTVESEDSTAKSDISWMVIGERKDKHMMDTDWTDDDGKVIVEPLKTSVESAKIKKQD